MKQFRFCFFLVQSDNKIKLIKLNKTHKKKKRTLKQKALKNKNHLRVGRLKKCRCVFGTQVSSFILPSNC